MMQFVDGFDKLAFHLYLRDYRHVFQGLERAQQAVKNMATDLGLSAEALAVKLDFAPNLGKLEEGEQSNVPVEAQIVETVPVTEEVIVDEDFEPKKMKVKKT